MKQEEINEAIEEFKRDHVQWIQDKMEKEGEIGPMIALLALKKDTDTMGLVFAPIFGDFSDERKDEVVKKIIPHLFEQVKEQDMIPYCFSFCSEVWIRKMSTKKIDVDKITTDMIKELPKTEALLITFETKETATTFLFDMERTGKSINEEGEVVDQIKLTPSDLGKDNSAKMAGRFTNIFKKYAE